VGTVRGRARTAWRLAVVLYRLVPLLLVYARDRRRYLVLGGPREVTPEDRENRAGRLLGAFVALGPTFIKLGQVLSTRADALPREYTETLSELQDDVPPTDWSAAEEVIDEDIGGLDRFDYFDRETISAASLGQVYVASVGGERCAVKVLRPGVRETVETDVRLMRSVLSVVARFVDDSTETSVRNLVDQFEESVHEEVDYERERRDMETIRDNFAGDPDVVVPEVYEHLSGDRVITMEYVDSVKVDDVGALDSMGIDRGDVVRELQRTYTRMALEDGLFHADPHPGNIGVDEEGRLVFYDFGLVGRLSEGTRASLYGFYEAVRDDDTDRMYGLLVEIGVLDDDHDAEEVGPMLRAMVDDLKDDEEENRSAQDLIVGIQDSMYGFPVHVTRELALLFRAITVLEGVCASLDEEFDFTYEAYLYIIGEEYDVVADALDAVPDFVADRVGADNIRWVEDRVKPLADLISDLRGEG